MNPFSQKLQQLVGLYNISLSFQNVLRALSGRLKTKGERTAISKLENSECLSLFHSIITDSALVPQTQCSEPQTSQQCFYV